MKIADILRLLKAGYTKDEIKAMEEDPEPDPKPEPDPDPEPDPEPGPDEKYYVSQIEKLTEQVKTLTETMQQKYRDDAETTAPAPEEGEQVLKEILEKGVIE